MATDADIPNSISSTKGKVEDGELTCGELSDISVNQIYVVEKKIGSCLTQPPETIKALDKTEKMQEPNYKEDSDTSVVNKGNIVPTEDGTFLQSSSVSEGKPTENAEEDQLNTKEEVGGSHDKEEKKLLTVDLDEKNRSTELEIPNKQGNDFCVTHPNVEEVTTEGEKHDEVSVLDTGNEVDEAFEFPKEDEEQVDETYGVIRSPETTILEHISTGGADELEKGCELDFEEGTKVKVAAQDTSLTEAESDYTMQADSSILVSEEKGLETTVTSENWSNGIDIIAKSSENSNLGENKDKEIPTAVKNGEDEPVDKNEPEETEDQTEVDTAVCEKTSEAQEQDKGSYPEEKTPFVPETPEERITGKEHESVSAKNTGSTYIEKESANSDAQEQEMHTPSLINKENGMSNTSEADNCSEIGKLETSKDEDSSDIILQKGKYGYEMTFNKASEGEQEVCAKNLEGTSKESDETVKASVEFEAEGNGRGCGRGRGDSEAKSISPPTEKLHIKPVEDGEKLRSTHELMVEDKSSRVINIDEEINNDEDQTSDSIKEQKSTKQLLGEIERGEESEVNKEQTMDEESFTKELHVITVADENCETANKDLDLTPTQGIQATTPGNPSDSEIDKSKVAEGLNQELEAPLLRKAPEEEIQVIEKHVDLSSSESLMSEEKINKENIEDCDEKTDIAPAVVAEPSISRVDEINDVPLKTFDMSSETKTADTRKQDVKVDTTKLEETSSMVSHLAAHEQKKVENVSIHEVKLDAIDFEVEMKIPDAISKSKNQGAKVVDETGTGLKVGENDTNEIEEQKGVSPEALTERINQVVKSDSKDKIAPGQTPQAEKTEEQLHLSSSDLLSKNEDGKLTTTVQKTEDGCSKEDDGEVDTGEIKEQIEDASKAFSEPKNQCVEATSKDENALGPTLQGERKEEESNEIEEQTRYAAELLYELVNKGVEAASNEEIAAGPTLQAEKIEEQLQESSSVVVSNEEDGETITTIRQTEDGCKQRNGTQVNTNGLEEQIGDTSKALSEPINQGVEADSNEEIALGLIIQAKETEEPLQDSSSVVLSNDEYAETATAIEKIKDGCTKKDDTEVDNLKLEETPSVVSQPLRTTCPPTNNAPVENSDADTVTYEEIKALEAVSELQGPGFQEVYESETSPTAEISDTGKTEEEIKATAKIPYQGVETGTTVEKIKGESTKKGEAEVDDIKFEEATDMLSQFPTTENEDVDKESAAVGNSEADELEEAKISEVISASDLHGAAEGSTKKDETQPHEKAADSFEAGAKEKRCWQNEGPRELANFDLIALKDSQNRAPEQESIGLEEDSIVKPPEYIPDPKYADFASEHERTHTQCSSEDSSKDENAFDLRNSNEDSDSLPPPHLTTKELSTKEGEAINEDTSVEKITEVKEVARISHPVSPREETATKNTREDEILDSPKRGDKILSEPYPRENIEISDTQRVEIQRQELFDNQNAAVANIVEGGKSTQIVKHITDEEPVELSTIGNESKLVETKFHSTTMTADKDEKSQHQNETPYVLSDCKDTKVSHETSLTDHEISKDTQELEKGVESGEQGKKGEEREETTVKSILMDSDKNAQKKSHSILSGVGSKVKHSIAKVKKVITGKSSYPKTKIGEEKS